MAEELKMGVKEAVWDATGRNSSNIHAQIVQLEVKQDKFEQKVLVAEEYRLLIFKTSKPLKLEQSIHYGDITEISCSDISKISVLTVEGKLLRLAVQRGDTFLGFLKHVFGRISIINHSVPLDKRIPKIEAPDPAKDEILAAVTSSASQGHLFGPCGNFSNVYRSKCDQMGVECHEDVAWDVDAIYNSQNCYELNLSDFDHLTTKNMIPLMASLEHNIWFTKLNLSNIKMTADLQNELLKIFKENKTFEELNLSNTGIRSDFLAKLFAVSCSSLCSLDLSNNNLPLDDRAVSHLSNLMKSPSKGMKSLNFSRTSMTSAGLNGLAKVLSGNRTNLATLSVLDLSGNSLREEAAALQNFLAQQNRLKVLRLADTETPLENFFAASLRGCTQHLEVLDLSGCQLFQGSKRGSGVPLSWKQFFGSVSSLRSVNFSNNKFIPEAYKLIFEGLEENTVAADIELNFSGCQIGTSPSTVQVFEQSVERMTKVSSLDLSDNGFDQSICGIILKLVPNRNLKKLNIGRNLINVKTKFLHQVVDSLIALIQEDGSTLERLSVEGMKLKGDLNIFIDALGTNNSLAQLDISGNLIGDSGARTLSKALLTNGSLKCLCLDNNQITFQGFEYIANSLEKNMSLKVLPAPLNDLVPAMKLNQDRTEKALRRIESSINRNVSDKNMLNLEAAYKLQQWLLNSSDQEAFNENISDLSSAINEINASSFRLGDSIVKKLRQCETVLQEAREVKDLLSKLHELSTAAYHRGSLVSDITRILMDKTKGFNEELINFMNKNFPESLKSFSRQSRYDPKLSAKEEAELEKELRNSVVVLASRLLAPVALDRCTKFAEFATSSVALSVEFALYNAKSISSRLLAGESLGSEVDLRESLEEDRKVDDESSRTDLKRGSRKNRVRPSSEIVTVPPPSHQSKTPSGSGRLSVGVTLESGETATPVPKPRNKKKKAGVRQEEEPGEDKKRSDGPSEKSSSGLDAPVPARVSFDGLPEGGMRTRPPRFVPFLGNLTKSASHDELDEKAKHVEARRKKSLSRDALEEIVPCQASFLRDISSEDRTDGAKCKDSITSTGSGINSFHPSKFNEVESPAPELEVQPTQRLTHLCKDRPKRPKTKVPTRPVFNPEGEKEKEEDKAEREAEAEGDGARAEASVAPGEGVTRKESFKAGLTDSLLNSYVPKKPQEESPPSLPNSPPVVPEHRISLPKMTFDSEPKPAEPRMRRTTEGSVPSESSDTKTKDSPQASTVPGTVGTAAPTVAKRSLPPGAKPGLGLGGFAMPSANEIQQKRLSMRPVSEYLVQTDSEEKKCGVNANSETGSDPQSKVKPPPPLAPKPNKNFRDSRRESDTNPVPVLIVEDKQPLADPGNKQKEARSASFMEEFRKKQERNRNSDPK